MLDLPLASEYTDGIGESSWNKYIDDSEFMGMSMERNISKKVIGYIGYNHSYVLTVNGGV